MDCNADGIPDECQQALDCNGNGVPDECESPVGGCCVGSSCSVTAQTCCALLDGDFGGEGTGCGDCNNNTVPDACDIVSGFSSDCTGNGIPDDCDIAAGLHGDCNSNNIPDECELIPQGRCCAPDALCPGQMVCSLVTQCTCAVRDGQYLGDGGACHPNTCDIVE